MSRPSRHILPVYKRDGSGGQKALFHARTKQEDEDTLTAAMVKRALHDGRLELRKQHLLTVPARVWDLYGAGSSEEPDVSFDRKPDDRDADLEWWNQQSLTELDLQCNKLSSIDAGVGNLLDLTRLLISSNNLTTLPPEIGLLSKLRVLKADHNILATLPKALFQLPELRELHLQHNDLGEINAELSDAVMLEKLLLNHNRIAQLPDGIGFLVRCTELNVSDNQLTGLPSDFVNMRCLEVLDVSHNQMLGLPENFGQLRRLRRFAGRSNRFATVPDFEGCAALQAIDMRENCVAQLPAAFCEQQPQLEQLELGDNRLARLPDEICQLQKLEVLDVSANRLSALPLSLTLMPSLRSLLLHDNPIRTLPNGVTRSSLARVLEALRGVAEMEGKAAIAGQAGAVGSCGAIGAMSARRPNELELPDKYNMQRMHGLILTGRELGSVPDELFVTAAQENVSKVDLSNNRLVEMPAGLLHMARTVSDLNLGRNQMKIVPDFISQFSCITKLDLSNNYFSTLPPQTGCLITLLELNINNNRFESIPPCVYELVNLLILSANCNQIRTLDVTPTGLQALRNLQRLELENNQIVKLPPELGLVRSIKHLQIYGNAFRYPGHQILEKDTDFVMSYLRDRIPATSSSSSS